MVWRMPRFQSEKKSKVEFCGRAAPRTANSTVPEQNSHDEDYLERYRASAQLNRVSGHCAQQDAAPPAHTNSLRLPDQQNPRCMSALLRPREVIRLIIAQFYTRKVKYTAETFSEKLQAILDGFPKLQDIHPFHRDLLNTLYDADHFRIALSQLARAKQLIETVGAFLVAVYF
jgi:hypothetical protein